jgi:hypothetical protein
MASLQDLDDPPPPSAPARISHNEHPDPISVDGVSPIPVGNGNRLSVRRTGSQDTGPVPPDGESTLAQLDHPSQDIFPLPDAKEEPFAVQIPHPVSE